MKRSILAFALLGVFGGDAFAQFGEILKGRDAIKKGVSAVRTVRKEFTEEEEQQLGRIVAARVLATYPLSENERLQTYVALVGNTVAAYSSRPNLNWTFAVIETPVVNAFSAPGGYVFISIGALALIKSEAELASVLGHEIAHATEKHILKEIKRGNIIAEGVSLAQDTRGGGLSDEMAKKVGDIAIEKLFKTGLGRREELDADRIGVEIAGAAGYRQSSYLDFLNSLGTLTEQKTQGLGQLISTHPRPEDRIKSINPRIANSESGQLLAERWEKWTTARKR